MDLDTYFICSTPRTGSTLLCSLLKSSGVAGVPESYFRKQDIEKWATEWNLTSSENEGFTFSDYLEATIAAGQTKNSVCSVRIMWGTMDELNKNLEKTYPEIAGRDIDLLNHAFGRNRFIYLKRTDFVAQAVSRLKAEQTNVWHVTGDIEFQMPDQAYHYNFDRLQEFVKEAEEHNTAWVKWFQQNNIEPHKVLYEDLNENPVGETLEILDFLNLTLPSNKKLAANNKRMADSLSASWVERFRSEISSLCEAVPSG